MAITYSELKKNLAELDKRVTELCKTEAFTDGAVEAQQKQLSPKAGSGTTGSVPKHEMTQGAYVDGTVKDPERGLDSKAGSGATVAEKFANVTNQTGRMFNDGAVDKDEFIKCGACGATLKVKHGKSVKGKGEGPSNPAKRASKAKVPNPKGGDASEKTTANKNKGTH